MNPIVAAWFFILIAFVSLVAVWKMVTFIADLFEEWRGPNSTRKRRLHEIQCRLNEIHYAIDKSDDVFTRKRLFAEQENLFEERRQLRRIGG